ncbi:MAG: type II secretion system F family protein [Pseudomonadota bacterium]
MVVTIAVFAAFMSLLSPYMSGTELKSRMKTVALERQEIRERERARMRVKNNKGKKAGLRFEKQGGSIASIVENFDLRAKLADENTVGKLRAAGLRGEKPLTLFLFARFVMPFVLLIVAVIGIFGLDLMADHPDSSRYAAVIGVALAGVFLPNLYISNKAGKRQASIQRAWPDSLDLLLICVESGMSIEAAFRRVSGEIGNQSIELAEELVLVGAELSYLPERRQAYENLAARTGLETVKAVTQALIQAEKYGTPLGQALRVLADESRQHRMNVAEKKAAALPPKLTVPMIVFFLPVLMAVILGPAGMQISDSGVF